jgi:DNA-binding response OmpR family regulator
MRILLVEDEKEIASFIMKGLKVERFAIDWAHRSTHALMWSKVNDYDIAIIDIKLDGEKDGLRICRELRKKKKEYPVIMLSAIHDTRMKIECLNAGADDYLTKPFALAELLARIRALLRREKRVVGPILTMADLAIDINSHTAKRAGEPIPLNRKEFGLLEYFMRNPGTLLTRGMILEHVWETSTDPLTNTVDVHVRFLREKIDDGHDVKLIHTIHGHGYKMEE